MTDEPESEELIKPETEVESPSNAGKERLAVELPDGLDEPDLAEDEPLEEDPLEEQPLEEQPPEDQLLDDNAELGFEPAAPLESATQDQEQIPSGVAVKIISAVLPELLANRVRGGSPHILYEDWKEERKPAGTVVRLEDPEKKPLAFGMFDPDNDCIRVWPFLEAELSQAPDFGFFRRRVRRAAAWRKRLGLTGEEAAFRLIHGEGDGLAGLVVEIYAKHAVIHSYADYFTPFVATLAEVLLKENLAKSVVSKVRPHGETPVGRVDFTQLSPEPPPRTVEIVEDDVRYEVHLLGGVNTGLFCDMRDVRRAVRNLSPDQRVLNLFAYTGGFSIVAALANARSTATVEFAGGVVEWAKTNFRLNSIPTEGGPHRFIKADVFEFLKTARRKEFQWDLIVLDPPAVSTAPGRKWRLKTDYHRLIAPALKVLAPSGVLVAAANTLQSRPEGVEKAIREAARLVGRRLRLIDSFGLPADFPTQMIHPESRYLKVFFLLAE